MISYCLCCGKPLKDNEKNYHQACLKRLINAIDKQDFDIPKLDELIKEQIERGNTVPGVQKKLSATFQNNYTSAKKTISNHSMSYIIKFPSVEFPYITEMENLVMNMAEVCRIKTVNHALYLTKDNQYIYLTKRIDKEDGKHYPMEDFCQLSQRLTEDKYKGSYESLGDILDKYSSQPIADKTELLNRILFCYITGNNDMHLKNFSLISKDNKNFKLSPAYDLLNVSLINPKDKEEMALTINGKKKDIRRKDFIRLIEKYKISEKVYIGLVKALVSFQIEMEELIDHALISEEQKVAFKEQLNKRLQLLVQRLE